MKAKSLLFLIIVGMLLIDISCNRGACKDYRLDIVGITDIKFIQIIGGRQIFTHIPDSIEYDSFLYMVDFEGKKITSNIMFSLIGEAKADECPPPPIDWDLDSVKIFSIINNIKTDVTNQFSILDRYGKKHGIDNSDPTFKSNLISNSSSYYDLNIYFNLNTPPSKTDSFQFNFQFFDKKGRMFEKMSDPVVISP